MMGMSTFTESQHPRGQAGKFTTKAKAGAGVALDVYEPPPEPAGDAEPGLFHAADGTLLYGYDSGRGWNGFAQPWLSELSVQRLAQTTAGHREEDPEAPLVYRGEDGTWMVDEGPAFDDAVYRRFALRRAQSPDGEDVFMLSGWDFTPAEGWDDADRAEFADEGAAHMMLVARMHPGDVRDAEGDVVDSEDLPTEWDPRGRDELRLHFETFVEDNEAAIRAAQLFCPDYDGPGAIARAFWLQNIRRGGAFEKNERLGEVGRRLAESAESMVGYDVVVNQDGLMDVA